jgi:hypothetical protein
MDLAKLELRLTTHSFEQYNDRVERIEFNALRVQLLTEMQIGDFYNREDFIRIGDTWWVFSTDQNCLLLLTCYGKNAYFDFPAARKWARKQKDRINLSLTL